MPIPEGAKLEAITTPKDTSPGDPIAIYDVSDPLGEAASTERVRAKAAGKKRKPAFGIREPDNIDTCIVHKSGGNGPAGYRGALATMRFVVGHRGWWGAAYTFWLSREADRDPDGRIVAYRLQDDTIQSWHTGHGMNKTGVGLGVQGNYDGNWDLLADGMPKVDREPTPDQWDALPALVDYIEDFYPLITCGREDEHVEDYGLTGHWEHGKSVCPGDALRAWVMTRRGETIGFVPSRPAIPPPTGLEVDPYRFTPKQYQKALLILGFDPGPIDGKPGLLTRAALEDFQESVPIGSDGWYGPTTAGALLVALQARGLATIEAFDSHIDQSTD